MGGYAETTLVRAMSYLAESQSAIAHNLANVDSAGFKRRTPVAARGRDFATTLDERLPTIKYREGTDWKAGNMRETGNRLDIALGNDTFFRVQDAQGNVLYTRNGKMQIDREGRLTTPSGMRYLDQSGQPLQLGADTSPTDLSIAPNGQISDSKSGQAWGPIGIFKLPDANALQPIGGSLYRDTGKQVPLLAADGAQQGFEEVSNVDSLQEMVQMIVVQRSFSATQRALSGVGRMQDRLIDNISR